MRINYDHNGFPIILSEEASNTDASTNDKGNNNSGPSNGPTASPEESQRRSDAVREVARKYKHGDNDSVTKYLEGRITRPLTVDEVNSFMNDVHQHRISDLVDILDHHLRGAVANLTRSYRAVKVSAPNGWIDAMVNNVSDDEIISVARRLKARGHDLEDVKKFLGKRISKEKFANLSDKLDDDTYTLNLNVTLGDESIEPFQDFEMQSLAKAIAIELKNMEQDLNGS